MDSTEQQQPEVIQEQNQVEETKQEPQMEQEEVKQEQQTKPQVQVSEKDQQAALKIKEKGDQAYRNKQFPKAIQLYTNALEQNPLHTAVLCNRAMAYIQISKFEQAIQDAQKSIDIDNQKVMALQQVDRLKEAHALCKQGLEIDAQNKSLHALEKSLAEEIALDFRFPPNHPKMEKIINMLNWLDQGNTQFDKLKIRFYSDYNRGVCVRKTIYKKEKILIVPQSHLITLEMAKETSISKKIIKHKLDLLSPKHTFLSTFILLERLKPDSFWKPYLDVLPQSYPSLPIFFEEEELTWFEGSPFLQQIRDKIADMKKDYENVCRVSPELQEFTFTEFCWARMTASSRIFGLRIDGKKTDAFVPLADMLNHKRPKQTSWSFHQDIKAFVIEAMNTIQRGDQVYDSYGKKCNSRFLLNYGFIAENNDGNECAVKLYYSNDDPLYDKKEQFLEESLSPRTFRVVNNYEEKVVLQFIAHARFINIKKQEDLFEIMMSYDMQKKNSDEDLDGYQTVKTPCISVEHEIETLKFIHDVVTTNLKKYPQTLKEDLQLLEQPEKLTENQQNMIKLRLGEKEILHYFVDFTEAMMPLFKKNKKVTLLSLDYTH